MLFFILLAVMVGAFVVEIFSAIASDRLKSQGLKHTPRWRKLQKRIFRCWLIGMSALAGALALTFV